MDYLAEAGQQEMILDDDPFPERPCLNRRQKLPQLLLLAALPRQQSRQSDLALLQSSVMAEIIASTPSAS